MKSIDDAKKQGVSAAEAEQIKITEQETLARLFLPEGYKQKTKRPRGRNDIQKLIKESKEQALAIDDEEGLRGNPVDYIRAQIEKNKGSSYEPSEV